MLQCSICLATSFRDTEFCCPACARSSLYPLRIRHAKTLLSKETLGRQVQAVVTGVKYQKEQGPEKIHGAVLVQEGSKQFQHEMNLVETAETRNRIDRIIQQSRDLREQVEQYKNIIAARKQTAAGRRSDISTATATLSTTCANATSPLKKTIRKISHRHETLYTHLISARVYLCAEATALLGLRQKKGLTADGQAFETYVLGGGPLMDLRELNNYTPGEIAAALNNIAHLLLLVCYYLGVRLPAEVTNPGETRPTATIYQPFSSYLFYAHRKNFTLPLSDINIFGTQHVQNCSGSVPTGRPLTFDRKLLLLAREDPTHYSLCIEGLSLMAWDIAWLCRAQGLRIASVNWEDVCAIGKNLWLLLVYAPKMIQTAQTTPLASAHIDTIDAAPTLPSSKDKMMLHQQMAKMVGSKEPNGLLHLLGELSHSTTYGFLGSSFQTTPTPSSLNLKSWKFATPVRINDKLKSLLFAEMSGLEWEMLDEADLDSVEGQEGDQALLSSKPREVDGISTLATDGEVVAGLGTSDRSMPSNGDARIRGTSGWTKLKSRTAS